MGLLSLLKSVIGLGGSGSDTRSGTRESGQRDVDVAVEHEPDAEPATGSEAAVKGTETADVTAAETQSATPGDGSATATETETETEGDDEGVETAEEIGADEEEATETDETEADEDEEAEPATAVENADEPVDTIKGIGPSYAERLADIGIETVGDLLEHDAEEIAAETDLSEKRVGRWLDRARGGE
jgi:predicted flap endonuclease-1-like 5' DNA nuclease